MIQLLYTAHIFIISKRRGKSVESSIHMIAIRISDAHYYIPLNGNCLVIVIFKIFYGCNIIMLDRGGRIFVPGYFSELSLELQ